MEVKKDENDTIKANKHTCKKIAKNLTPKQVVLNIMGDTLNKGSIKLQRNNKRF